MSGLPPQQEKPRPPRSAVRPGLAPPRLQGWARINPAPRRPNPLRLLFEQYLIAGPVIGVLNALYRYHLMLNASLTPNPATHETVRQAQVWHGHFQHAYYITPQQNALAWALAIPGAAWPIVLIATLVALGVRRHYRETR